MPTNREGRQRSARRTHREQEERPAQRYIKNFGRQLFAASLCVTAVFFIKDIDRPIIRQSREALKYAVTYQMDWSWFQAGLTDLLQNWTDGSSAEPTGSAEPVTPAEPVVPAATDSGSAPGAARESAEGNPTYAEQTPSPEA